MKFISIALLIISLPALAFEGQPSSVALVTNPAQIHEVNLPELTRETFKQPKEACEGICYRALEFQEEQVIMVGEMMYTTHRFVVKVDSNGDLILNEDEPATLHLRESLTNTSLSISLNGRSISCFGISSKNLCTRFAVTDRY
ncbi:MAG: hypothetical protein HRT45_02725 [Bdellovibrionales bacterium]|nr:hypothetical protein [Bdellovibrionales bacterium]